MPYVRYCSAGPNGVCIGFENSGPRASKSSPKWSWRMENALRMSCHSSSASRRCASRSSSSDVELWGEESRVGEKPMGYLGS